MCYENKFSLIIIPLFITFGDNKADKNYGNITVKKKFKTRHVYIQSKYVKLCQKVCNSSAA